MNVNERIIDGIKKGVSRHWGYTKNLLRIKPEYLLTVSVADALTCGFESVCGLDLEIKLEEPTHAICADLLMNAVGFSAYFKAPKHKVSRKGKVDIYVKNNDRSWVIELKGFDPSVAEIDKEIIRLLEFLAANNSNNKCGGCFLAFPSSTNRITWIEKILAKANAVPNIRLSVSSERVETDEAPEDGIPVYYANCISIVASAAQRIRLDRASEAQPRSEPVVGQARFKAQWSVL